MKKIIGKVENINSGNHFLNATIKLENDLAMNLRFDNFTVHDIVLGTLYEFEYLEEVTSNEKEINQCIKITLATEVLATDELSKLMNYFYEYAPISLKKIKEYLEAKIEQIENVVLKNITNKMYQESLDKFYTHPAGTKFHHSYVGGLSYHTYTMLKMVDPFVLIYPFLNRDLLYAGVIIHDIEKTLEISGADGEYTTAGLLIGHIVMGTLSIDRIATQLGYDDLEEVLLLKHMMLSHHGQLNFGSPKKPQTAEALMLWFMDSIDSKFTVLGETLEQTEPGTFTSMLNVLDRMRFYKSKK